MHISGIHGCTKSYKNTFPILLYVTVTEKLPSMKRVVRTPPDQWYEAAIDSVPICCPNWNNYLICSCMHD